MGDLPLFAVGWRRPLLTFAPLHVVILASKAICLLSASGALRAQLDNVTCVKIMEMLEALKEDTYPQQGKGMLTTNQSHSIG